MAKQHKPLDIDALGSRERKVLNRLNIGLDGFDKMLSMSVSDLLAVPNCGAITVYRIEQWFLSQGGSFVPCQHIRGVLQTRPFKSVDLPEDPEVTERIATVLERIEEIWKLHPHLRFLQLISAICPNHPFYLTDAKLLQIVEEKLRTGKL